MAKVVVREAETGSDLAQRREDSRAADASRSDKRRAAVRAWYSGAVRPSIRPGGECFASHVCGPTRYKKAIKVSKRVGQRNSAPTQGTFYRKIASDQWSDRRRERFGFIHDAPPERGHAPEAAGPRHAGPRPGGVDRHLCFQRCDDRAGHRSSLVECPVGVGA